MFQNSFFSFLENDLTFHGKEMGELLYRIGVSYFGVFLFRIYIERQFKYFLRYIGNSNLSAFSILRIDVPYQVNAEKHIRNLYCNEK